MSIKFPITVNSVSFKSDDTLHESMLFGGACGDMVAVRPCDKELNGKTFLGVLLGEIALSQSVAYNKDAGELVVSRALYNPAIFVPELRRVVYGCGSWWGRIKDADQLRQITDGDINNVWYVQAMKQLQDSNDSVAAGAE